MHTFSLMRIGLAMVCSFAVLEGTYGQDDLRQVSATSIYRSLAYAARALAEQTHTIVTFEELVFEYPGDFQPFQYGANSGP
jgi:hypothetical protein